MIRWTGLAPWEFEFQPCAGEVGVLSVDAVVERLVGAMDKAVSFAEAGPMPVAAEPVAAE